MTVPYLARFGCYCILKKTKYPHTMTFFSEAACVPSPSHSNTCLFFLECPFSLFSCLRCFSCPSTAEAAGHKTDHFNIQYMFRPPEHNIQDNKEHIFKQTQNHVNMMRQVTLLGAQKFSTRVWYTELETSSN